MRLLVDENLSARIVGPLDAAEHDAVHVTAIGLGSADDERNLQAAADEAPVVLTADADFSALLAPPSRSRPSVVMLRSSDRLTPDEQADLIILALEQAGDELETGEVASVTPERIRLRSLPITEAGPTTK